MQWYVVQVTTAHEGKVKSYLDKRKKNGLAGGIGEVVIPKKQGKPVIPGYVFLQADAWPEFYLLGCNSRYRVIGKVSDEELERLLSISDNAEVPRSMFKKGDEVIICTGPLEGVKGIVLRSGTRRSKISFFDGEVIIDAENKQLIPAEKGA